MFLETIEEEDESAIESCWTPIIAYMWSFFEFDFDEYVSSRSLVF
jgi:hypothetical protein